MLRTRGNFLQTWPKNCLKLKKIMQLGIRSQPKYQNHLKAKGFCGILQSPSSSRVKNCVPIYTTCFYTQHCGIFPETPSVERGLGAFLLKENNKIFRSEDC